MLNDLSPNPKKTEDLLKAGGLGDPTEHEFLIDKTVPTWVGDVGAKREEAERSQPRWCIGCGYDLRRVYDAGACPECGRLYPPWISPPSPMERSRMVPGGMIIAGVAAAVQGVLAMMVKGNGTLGAAFLVTGGLLIGLGVFVLRIQRREARTPSLLRLRFEARVAPLLPGVQIAGFGCLVILGLVMGVLTIVGMALSGLFPRMP